jgi:hypothetical protein
MGSTVIEQAKMVHAANLAAYEARTATSRELFKSVIEMAKVTVTSLILINGGSAVALLAFIGQLASAEQPRIPIASFATPMLYFGVGVGTAAFFGAMILLTQKLYAQGWTKCAVLTSWASAIIGLSSFASFAVGSYCGYKVLAGTSTDSNAKVQHNCHADTIAAIKLKRVRVVLSAPNDESESARLRSPPAQRSARF